VKAREVDPAYDQVLLARYEAEACAATEGTIEAAIRDVLLKAARMAMKGYVVPSIETEGHRALKDVADEAAIKVFAENVRKLLLAAPYGSKSVLGVDPAFAPAASWRWWMTGADTSPRP
jgi:uncharacterized protein